jgi:cell division protein FtsW (lipid II flippase)
MYFILIYRGMKIALSSNDPFNALIAIGAAAMLGFQTFVIIGGVIKLIPLTGVTLPFVSYGGSSMVASFMLVGVIQSTVIQTKPSDGVYPEKITGERYSESY